MTILDELLAELKKTTSTEFEDPALMSAEEASNTIKKTAKVLVHNQLMRQIYQYPNPVQYIDISGFSEEIHDYVVKELESKGFRVSPDLLVGKIKVEWDLTF